MEAEFVEMECEEARGLLAESAFEALDPRRSAALAEHLAACPRCAEEWEDCRAALAAAGGLKEIELPAAARERISRRLRGEAGERRRKRRRRRAAAACALSAGAMAAALFVALLFLGYFRRGGPLPGGDWPFVMGDAGNSRHVPGTHDDQPPHRIAWTRRVGGLPGTHKPIAAAGVVVLNVPRRRPAYRGGGALAAFDLRTGRRLWRREFSTGDFYKAKGFPDRFIAGSRLYVTDGRRCLVLDVATGKESARIQPPAPGMGWWFLAGGGDRLFGTSRDGGSLFCLRRSDGAVLWRRRLPAPTFVPALADGVLYAHCEGGEVLALEAATGRVRWRRSAVGPRRAGVVHARAGRLAVCGRDDEIAALRSADGRVLWRRRVPGASSAGLALGENALFTVGGAVALDWRDGRQRWLIRGAASGTCSAPAVAGGMVLAPAGPRGGRLAVLAANTGAVREVIDGGARQACDGVIILDGSLYVVSGGKLTAVAGKSTG